ncbi:imidazole glycerol phosphate synthase subunit HisH [Prochlorococcus marinus]|uniref:imidazole glycerol phosphate synthase subunit HisH n=1 Tax=Prochlorococcus marinus TaxID=1219 RepID=UPI001ADC5D94|nr:imidazole glycerol phosphate synthase subunit HisH [Prochlorococcus marinus]MBO8204688.1 imidazole glycerol phosphate synthase subunit HisH [Prochlorococcus marinus CUG1415]MBW3043977.1 imidazole glycerol phosphate synthase subunit HisH [Prochlorococcus marinus str. MU1415]
MHKIGLVDYGMGNIHSVTKSLESLGEEILLIKNFSESKDCKAIILPGVGAFDPAMDNLVNMDLISDLKNWINSGKSFLGICLGLQLLFESSDEGKVQGLGIVKGKIQKIPNIVNQRIPHMGWCQLLPKKTNTLLDLEELNDWVYFVHSYHAIPEDLNIIAAQVNYGSEKLTAIIESDNLLACQFHPEKSGKTGEKLLRRWLNNIQ